ncbi:MAG: hypothetical protein ACI4DO_04510 [Roseburia sp.]
MNISGIRPYMGYYDYNSIQRVGQEAEVQPSSEGQHQLSQPQQALSAERDYDSQTFGAADYAKQYQPDAVYDLKGADSDIHNLDVEQALSDMQKDQVLQQYQFFVGDNQDGVRASTEAAAASARAVENFTL